MGVKVTNNAFGTLSSAINTSVTTITLDSGQGARFPTLGASDYFYATLVDTSNNLEIVKVTARSSDSMTVTRGQDNTTARAFAIGDRFELRPVAALFEDVGADFDAGIVFNESGNDVDYRFESNTKTDAFFIDGGTSRIGINHDAPSAELDIRDDGSTYNPLIRFYGSGNNSAGTLMGGIDFYNADTSGRGPHIGATIETTSESSTGARSTLLFKTYDDTAAADGTDATTTMTLTPDGYVLRSRIPSFYVYGTNSSSQNFKTNGAHVLGDTSDFSSITEYTDSLGNFNTTNGRFTAPVAGTYWFSAGVTPQNSNSTPRGYIQFLKNGSGVGPQQYYYNVNYNGTAASVLLYLAVNDYVQATGQGTNSVSTSLYRGHFAGYLIG